MENRSLTRWPLVTLIAVIVAGFGGLSSSSAQEPPPEDLTELSLEELSDLRVLGVNVLGTHTHYAGEWMVAYRNMFMSMDGNRDGTNGRSVADVLQDFPISPTKMTMQMQMVSLMYAPSDAVTLMAMAHFVDLEMDHITRSGMEFTTRTSGIGDSKVGGKFTVYDRNERRVVVSGVLGVPTGSIEERGRTPMGPDQKLPYPMQLGSGTYDLLPGVLYLVELEKWAYGGELMGVVRLGENSEGYTLGDRTTLEGWLSRSLSDRLAWTASLAAQSLGDISGADSELNPMMVPTADPSLRGGERIDASFAFSYFLPQREGTQGLRFALEATIPVYQDLDGPQLETDWSVQGGIQWIWSFKK